MNVLNLRIPADLNDRYHLMDAIPAEERPVVFIGLASLVVPGIFAWGTVLTGIASKLAGAALVAWWVARRAAGATAER